MTNNKTTQQLEDLREWFRSIGYDWWADKADEQLLHETRLDLYRSNVRELPEAIGCMKSLEWINLNFNPVERLPESIGELARLESLQLSEAKLEHLPESLGKLKRLSFLRIEDSGLTALPESIGNLSALNDLRLSGNRITRLPTSMTRLTGLQYVDLSGNPLGDLPEFIGEWGELQYLNVRNTELTRLPDCIGKLKQLRRLDCDPDRIANVPPLALYQKFEGRPLNRIQSAFAKFFSYFGHELPDEDVQMRRRGQIGGEDDGDYSMGDVVRYLFGRNDRGEYLDFYCRHRHAGDQHWRIFEDGSMEQLDAPTSWRHSSDDPEEDARLQDAFYAENTRIYRMLRDKGFED
ncbi:hypothetical protein MASR1M60_30310 [Rhodocyclaceae bacterium]